MKKLMFLILSLMLYSCSKPVDTICKVKYSIITNDSIIEDSVYTHGAPCVNITECGEVYQLQGKYIMRTYVTSNNPIVITNCEKIN